jgi:hypothetical protein
MSGSIKDIYEYQPTEYDPPQCVSVGNGRVRCADTRRDRPDSGPLMTLEEAGWIMGFSRTRAWQLEQSALAKLRIEFAKMGIHNLEQVL